jgi:hypothetical protein
MSHWENKGGSDECYTPKYVFDALECEFDMDVAAPVDLTHISVPAKEFIHADALNLKWNGFVWMNPPFSGRNGKDLWLSKLIEHGSGIALMPDRTSAPWWTAAARKSDSILFVTGKIKFINADGEVMGSPSNGTTLFAYGKRATQALRCGEKNNLGVMLFKS